MMKNISIKLKLILFLFVFLVLVSFWEKDSNFFIKTIIAVIATAATEALCFFIKSRSLNPDFALGFEENGLNPCSDKACEQKNRRRIQCNTPRTLLRAERSQSKELETFYQNPNANSGLKLTQSSLVTGLIIGFVLSSSQEWRLFLLAGFLSIILKHLIRLDGKHIFNPAALGIFLTVVIFNKAAQWHGAYCWGMIIPFGLYFTWKIRKISLVSAYFVSYILMSIIQWHWLKQPFWNQIYYANYFFILVMLVEPKTSPFKFTQNVFFGIIVSVLSFILYWVRLPFDADLPALLVGNLIFRFYSRKKGVARGK